MNDCHLIDRLGSVAAEHGALDVFAAQFSGATWHPTCYEYPREQYEEIAQLKIARKFDTLARGAYRRIRRLAHSAGPRPSRISSRHGAN